MNIINFETDHAHKILEGDLNSDDFRPSVEISQFVEGMVVPEMSFTGIHRKFGNCSWWHISSMGWSGRSLVFRLSPHNK